MTKRLCETRDTTFVAVAANTFGTASEAEAEGMNEGVLLNF